MSPTNVIYLRPSLDYDPSRPTSRNNLVAFSPDIIPLPSPQDPSLLVASYDTYVERPFGLKQEPAYIYVRGAATDKTQPASANVVVGAVKNELVLWPQLLNAATKVGSAMLSTTASSGVAVSDKPIKFTPNPDWPWDTQRTSFLAVSDDSFGKLKPAKNYKELLSGVAVSPGIVLSNTHFADAYTNHGGPIFYAFTTRLRFFDDSGKPTKLELSAEAVGIPPGMSIKFSDFDVPKSIINLPWTPISSTTTAGVTFEVTDGFDVSMYVEIRKDSPDVAPPDYASISVVVSAVQQGHIVEQEVIGAEHVLFYSNLPHKLSTIGGELAVGSPGPKVQLRNDLAGSQPTSALLSAGETTESRTWIFDLSLPPGWSPTWQGVLQLVLTNWPVGGTIQLTTPVIVGGTHIGIGPTTVTNPNQVEGIFFLGLQGPWDTSATVTWTRGNGPDLQPGSKICVSLARIIDDSPLLKQLGFPGTVGDRPLKSTVPTAHTVVQGQV
ncbi:hypothetical protein BKA62DRAFT_753168 [Auriculariales sp. MPI-PUGE-AT-0066]|nr:hypothetical protein BKA62DRAFT_753168 [Auriculariales sp. MPI-PUGE-AT-0066]